MAVGSSLAYVADGNGGLWIIDVSDPANPVRRGGYDTPDNTMYMTVAGSLAYVAAGHDGLWIIDVSDPANPVHRGGYDTPGDAEGVAGDRTPGGIARH